MFTIKWPLFQQIRNPNWSQHGRTVRAFSQTRDLSGTWISYLAVRELRISGADVARRMNIDRSSVSRAVGRVEVDPALKNMSKALLGYLYPEG
jgi:hypothetical protein